jgi:hypothetical protein
MNLYKQEYALSQNRKARAAIHRLFTSSLCIEMMQAPQCEDIETYE